MNDYSFNATLSVLGGILALLFFSIGVTTVWYFAKIGFARFRQVSEIIDEVKTVSESKESNHG